MGLLLLTVCLGACVKDATLVRPPLSNCPGAAQAPHTLRAMTYNIKSGLESSLDEISEEILQYAPEILALQEVDRGVDRTRKVDQTQVLADRGGYQGAFAGAIERGGGSFGIALLSKLPFESVERIELPGAGSFEPRVAIDAILCVGAERVRVIATHADIFATQANLRALADHVAATAGQGTILLGDLNATPDNGSLALFRGLGLSDLLGDHSEGPTFWPLGSRVDYVLVDAPWRSRFQAAGISTRKVSDHFAAFADFALETP